MKKIYMGVALSVAVILCVSLTIFASPNRFDVHSLMVPVYDLSVADYVNAVNDVNLALTKMRSSAALPVTVTFAERMSFEDLDAFSSTYDIDCLQVEARALMSDGTRVTIATVASEGIEQIENNILRAVEENHCDQYLGVIGLYGILDSAFLPSIQNDPIVFLVDTTQEYLNSNKTSASSIITSINDTHKSNITFPKSLAWELEDLNMIE